MKKIMTGLIVAIVAAVACACFAACANGEGSVAGTYKYYAAVTNGETHYVTDADSEVTEDYIVLVLNSDGSGEQKMQVSETQTVTVPFKWKIEGATLTITSNGTASVCTLENDIITLDIAGNKALLKKTA